MKMTGFRGLNFYHLFVRPNKTWQISVVKGKMLKIESKLWLVNSVNWRLNIKSLRSFSMHHYGEKVTWFLPIDWISVSKSVMSDDLKQKRTRRSAYLNEINYYIALFHLDLMTLRQLLMSPTFYRFNMFVYFTPCERVCMYACVHACVYACV